VARGWECPHGYCWRWRAARARRARFEDSVRGEVLGFGGLGEWEVSELKLD